MALYSAPVSEFVFLLADVLGWERFANLPGFAEADLETVETILSEAARLCEETLVPLNRSGDAEGCRHQSNGAVETPQGFREAYKAYAEGGWIGLAAPVEWGGQGLPYTIAALVNLLSASANMAFTMYPGLTQTAIAALLRHASEDVKRRTLPGLVSGRWAGTMNLTEPQCGTDLGLIKTKATRRPDGTFALTGQKIFISAGEHDLTENIIHLVLARGEGAPAGTRGLSLFVVPKRMIGEDGALGQANGVSCASIERKMGIHANATCVMNYDGAVGWLVGEENRGLNAMFTMMNEARLGVAAQGLGLSEVAYVNAAAYARERLQGRALSGAKSPEKAADPLIVHPDVRRLLLTMRAFNEPARALLLDAALQSDLSRCAADEAERLAADDRLGLLTPVLKGVFTDVGFDNTVRAQQIFGGHGYIADVGVEQFVRDARIAMIYEGANAIQALDLVGRKLPKDGGRALKRMFESLSQSAQAGRADPDLADFGAGLSKALDCLQQATLWLMQNALGDPDNAGAAAYDYMHLLGLVLLGDMWVRIVRAARERAARTPNAQTQAALADKKALAHFYFGRLSPETALRLARIQTGAKSVMSLPAERF